MDSVAKTFFVDRLEALIDNGATVTLSRSGNGFRCSIVRGVVAVERTKPWLYDALSVAQSTLLDDEKQRSTALQRSFPE